MGVTLQYFPVKCRSIWSSGWTGACSLVWCHPAAKWILRALNRKYKVEKLSTMQIKQQQQYASEQNKCKCMNAASGWSHERWNIILHKPCKRAKYSSLDFFMISGVHVASVNMSSSLARVVLRSLRQRFNIYTIKITMAHNRWTTRAEHNPHLQILLAAGLDATPYRLKDTGAVDFRGFRWNQWVIVTWTRRKTISVSLKSIQKIFLYLQWWQNCHFLRELSL